MEVWRVCVRCVGLQLVLPSFAWCAGVAVLLLASPFRGRLRFLGRVSLNSSCARPRT